MISRIALCCFRQCHAFQWQIWLSCSQRLHPVIVDKSASRTLTISCCVGLRSLQQAPHVGLSHCGNRRFPFAAFIAHPCALKHLSPDPCKYSLPMSEGKQSDGSLGLPIIKVHVMMPGASSSQESTYASIKYSKTTTAEDVINHIRKKKVILFSMPYSSHLLIFLQQLPPDVRFELTYLPNTNTTPSCFHSECIVLQGPAIISDIIFKVISQFILIKRYPRSRFSSGCGQGPRTLVAS